MVFILSLLVVMSFLFVFFAARNSKKITSLNAIKLLFLGFFMFVVAGIVGLYIDGQSFLQTFTDLSRSNQERMAIHYGVVAIYFALLSFTWVFASKDRN